MWEDETGVAVGRPPEGVLALCRLFLTLPMAGTSSPGLVAGLFESGVLRLAL